MSFGLKLFKTQFAFCLSLFRVHHYHLKKTTKINQNQILTTERNTHFVFQQVFNQSKERKYWEKEAPTSNGQEIHLHIKVKSLT